MPEKHHYFPVFYQTRCAGADGRVCVYSKPHREVKALRRRPDQVGFEYDLYTISGVEFETASHLERRFFLQTDNDASQALAILESNPTAAAGDKASEWMVSLRDVAHSSGAG